MMLLSLGHGYTASALAERLTGWHIVGTTRDPSRRLNVETLVWPAPIPEGVTHVLASAAPDEDGDAFLATHGAQLAALDLQWAGYLSTTGVYGDHGGAWVDEDTPPAPTTKRGRQRLMAERQWQALMPVHIFRLAGIYGPGRGPFEKVASGTARRIVKPGQVFSRIHVEDIARVLEASIANPSPGIYNVCDDDPAPPEDVLEYAAHLLGLPPPPAIPYDEAEMTPMQQSFYAESKRVRNDRIKRLVALKFPDYRAGLADLLASHRVIVKQISPPTPSAAPTYPDDGKP